MSKRALILIDIQNDYFAGGKWSLEGMDGATANAARVLAAARQAGDKVIHVRHEFESADAPFFVPGSAGANIHPQVQPLASEVVVLKHQVNAFLGTDLKAQLDAAGIEQVTLVGAMSHMCIDAAARASSDFGYATTVIHDACATRDHEFEGQSIPAARCMPPIWPHWTSPTRTWFRPSSIWPAESAGAEALQLHLAQATERTAEGKIEVALSVEFIQGHRGLDVEWHATVVALVDQGDEAAHRIVIKRQRRQLPIPGIDPFGTVLGATGDAPLALLATQARHFAKQDGRKALAQFDEIHRCQWLLAQITEASP